MQPQLRLTVFGSPQFVYQDQPLSGFISNKARALLIYLAVTGRAHSRDALSELLWANRPATKRENLKKVLSNLRRMDGVVLVEEGRQNVVLDPGSYWLDVAEFSRLVNAETRQGATAEQQAVELYHDDFLVGFNTSLSLEFEEWALSEQTRLKMQLIDLLRRLADRYTQQHELTNAITTLRRLVKVEPWQEESHRILIKLLAQNNDVGSALAQFEICKENLHQELDIDPSPATLELVANVRDGTLQAKRPSPAKARKQTTKPLRQKQAKTAVEFPLVGREREWQIITGCWNKLSNSHFICIGGEAGIGKTRLAEELLLLAEGESAPVARTRSHELQGQLAFGPITDWLRTASLELALDTLEDGWRAEISRLLPELLIEGADPPQPMTEGWQRKRFFDALVEVFTLVGSPLLLVLDDLQWTDADTLEWLQYLIESSDAPILVVGTVRLNEINADHALHRVRQQLRRQDRLTEINISELTIEATSQLASTVIESDLEDERSQRLFNDTAGNPLFVIETMRAGPTDYAQAESAVRRSATATGLHSASVRQSISMPEKMHSVIQSRLAQLSPQAQQLAQLCATIGRAFDVTLLSKAADSDEKIVLILLDELWQRRIIKEVDRVHFDFSHDRIRDVAYAEIGPIKQRVLHRSVAEGIEAIHSGDLESVYGQLATHCTNAGLAEKAITFSRQAAKQALHLSANNEAIGYIQNGLELIRAMAESPDILREELALQTTLTVPIHATRGGASPDAKEIFERILELCRRLNEEPDLPVLRGLVSIYLVGAELVEASKLSHELLMRAKKENVPAYLAQAHFITGSTLFWMGKFPDARAHLHESLNYHELNIGSDHLTEFGQSPASISRIFLTICLCCMGYPEQASKLGKESLELADQERHALSHAYVLSFYTRFQQCLHLPNSVLEYVEKTLQATTQGSFAFWKAASRPFRGWALSETEDPTQGLAQIVEGIQAYHDTGSQVSTPWYLGLAASAHYRLGNIEGGIECLEEALNLCQETKDGNFEAELWRLHGEHLRCTGQRKKEAEKSFLQAIEVAQRQHAKLWELRATVSLCRLWREQGKFSAAHQMLSEIYGWFTEGFDTVDLVEAKALLTELESNAKPRGATNT